MLMYLIAQIRILFVSLIFLMGISYFVNAQHTTTGKASVSLAGIWKFKMDPFEAGISANGVQLLPSLAETVILPGSTDQNHKGYKTQTITSLRLTRPYEYKGVAWYEKEVFIPENWKDKEIELFLERTHWLTELWVNGKHAGKRESLSTPHRYLITPLLKIGTNNKILLKVDNDRIYNIEYAHAISEETQTNWNGIIGQIMLNAFDKVSIRDVQVYPDLARKEAKLHINILNTTTQNIQGGLQISGETINVDSSINIPTSHISFWGKDSLMILDVTVSLGERVQTWDEFLPALYRLQLNLHAVAANSKFSDNYEVKFGVRSIRTSGTRLELNGKPLFIRGTVNCAEFPITGYPPMDKEAWMRIFKTCKDYGLNAMRFHTWCPPNAAFEAADELGVYLQVENADWRFTVGKDSLVNAFLRKESEDILRTYGNHPSFIMFCEGNELVGPKVKEFLSEQVSHWKAIDSRRLYTGSAAYPLVDENDYHVLYGLRPHRWKEGLNSRFNKQALNTLYDYSDYVAKHPIPIITHEVGQWCSYPNFEEIEKYTGVLKPYNYELFRELLRDKHMLDQARDFMMASGKFKVIQNKEEIESYLRTPGMAGYHFLQLNDFPGQGTAPVGLVDIFWDPKPFASAKEINRFQNKSVLLLRTESFTWTSDQVFKGTIQIANYDSAVIRSAHIQWTFELPDGKIYASGSFEGMDIPIGSPFTLGEIKVPLSDIEQAVQMRFNVSIANTDCSNHWDVWVYPARLPDVAMQKVMIADWWGVSVERFLEKGGSVLLLADTSRIITDVVPGFSGISWNTVWSGMPPNLLGILCDPGHPALRYFPTEYHSNWQWWDIVSHSKPMVLDHFPYGFKPLVQLIPDWNKPQKIGIVFEVRVGKGKLLIVNTDLKHHLSKRPVARQLLYSLKKYVASDDFNPETSVELKELRLLFENKAVK